MAIFAIFCITLLVFSSCQKEETLLNPQLKTNVELESNTTFAPTPEKAKTLVTNFLATQEAIKENSPAKSDDKGVTRAKALWLMEASANYLFNVNLLYKTAETQEYKVVLRSNSGLGLAEIGRLDMHRQFANFKTEVRNYETKSGLVAQLADFQLTKGRVGINIKVTVAYANPQIALPVCGDELDESAQELQNRINMSLMVAQGNVVGPNGTLTPVTWYSNVGSINTPITPTNPYCSNCLFDNVRNIGTGFRTDCFPCGNYPTMALFGIQLMNDAINDSPIFNYVQHATLINCRYDYKFVADNRSEEDCETGHHKITKITAGVLNYY